MVQFESQQQRHRQQQQMTVQHHKQTKLTVVTIKTTAISAARHTTDTRYVLDSITAGSM